MSTATPIPTVDDKGRRALRTAVQVALAFVSLAAYVPVIEPVFGAPHSSNLAEYAAGAGAWVTAVATIITIIMAIPAVDKRLTVLGVGSVPASRVQVVLRQVIEETEAAFQAGAPILEAAVPAAAPGIELAEDAVEAIKSQLADEAPTAPVAAPASA